MTRLFALPLLALLLIAGSSAAAPKRTPADALKGKVILSSTPFPASFANDEAFIRHMKKADTKLFHFNAGGKIPIEFMAFFAQPIGVTELTATIYDITEGRQSKDSFPLYPGDRNARILASFMELTAEKFEVERRYHLVLTPGYRGQVLAEAVFVVK